MTSVRQNYNKARELMKRFTAINSQKFPQPSRQSPGTSLSLNGQQQQLQVQRTHSPSTRTARFAPNPAVVQSRKSDDSGINSIADAIAAAQAAERERIAAQKRETGTPEKENGSLPN